MKKRILTLLLSLVLAGSLAGCGSGDDKTGESSQVVVEDGAEQSVKQEESQKTDQIQSQDNQEESESKPMVIVPDTDEEEGVFSKQAMQDLIALRQDLAADNGVLGIAYLGFVAETDYYSATVEEVLEWVASDYGSVYAFMKELDRCELVQQAGYELYMLLPQSDDYRMTIYSQSVNFEGEMVRGDMLYQAAPGESILLLCNESDIMSNVEIFMTGDLESYSFTPYLSLENGRVGTMDQPGLVDFTMYGDSGYDSTPEQEAYYMLESHKDVGYLMEQGMSLLYSENTEEIMGEQCMVFQLGTDTVEKFTTERMYAVSPYGTIYLYDALGDAWIED